MTDSLSQTLTIHAAERPVPFCPPRRLNPVRLLAAFAVSILLLAIAMELGLRAYEKIFREYFFQKQVGGVTKGTLFHPRPFYDDMEANWFSRTVLAEDEIYRPRVGKHPGYVINNMGFRGADFSAKRPGVKRILVLGDSVPFGWTIGEDQAWPAQMANALSTARKETVEVLNLGRVATSSYGTRKDLEKFGDTLNPDAIVISVAWYNDFQIFHDHPDMDEEAAVKNHIFDWRVKQAASPLLYSRIYQWWALQFDNSQRQKAYYRERDEVAQGNQSATALGVVRRVPYDKFRANLEYFCKWGKDRGIPVFFTTPRMKPTKEKDQQIVRAYASAIEEVASANGGIVSPTREILNKLASEKPPGEIWADDVHLTPFASREVGRAVAHTLLEHWNSIEKAAER